MIVNRSSCDRFHPLHEVADLLGVSKRTVYRLIASGDLPKLKVRGRSVVSEAAIAKYQSLVMRRITS